MKVRSNLKLDNPYLVGFLIMTSIFWSATWFDVACVPNKRHVFDKT